MIGLGINGKEWREVFVIARCTHLMAQSGELSHAIQKWQSPRSQGFSRAANFCSNSESMLFVEWIERIVHERPNAHGKPRRSAQHGGHPQAELVGVGLTKWLGARKNAQWVIS